MICKRVQEWISLETDGQLAPDRVPHLLAHLEACGECRSYREDLQLGRRLLAATSVGPSAGFEWRLQLRLNQSLKEAARAASDPWPLATTSGRRWLGHFGISASLSLAAVLAVALFFTPGGLRTTGPRLAQDDGLGARVPTATDVGAELAAAGLDSSRRPLTRPATPGLFNAGDGAFGRPVAGGAVTERLSSPQPASRQYERLQQENLGLRQRLAAAEHRAQVLQARLDSLARHP